MSLDISITLSDNDLALFVDDMRAAEKKVLKLDAEQIIGAAQALLKEARTKKLPDFVNCRLKCLDTLIAMAGDVGFGLPKEDLDNVLAALAYFASPDDMVPDNVPVLGFIDDAIMIELCAHELEHEIDAYNDFQKWRDDEASRRGEDAEKARLTRVEWAEARRVEAIERMHQRRFESYNQGRWAPVLFQVR